MGADPIGPPESGGARQSPVRSWLAPAGVVAAAWAMLPRFAGPELNTTDRVEIADHIVPGLVVLAVAVTAAVMRTRRATAPAGTLLFISGLIVVLAGLWMTATHVPLLAQAAGDEVTWGAAIYHGVPGFAVLILGLVWSGLYWSEAAPAESAGA